MSLSKLGKALLIGVVIIAFVSIDTCSNQAFKPKPVKPSINDYTIIPFTHDGVEFLIVQSKNGTIEVVNATDQKKIMKFLR